MLLLQRIQPAQQHRNHHWSYMPESVGQSLSEHYPAQTSSAMQLVQLQNHIQDTTN